MKKVKAAALQYVLIITLVITLLSALFFLSYELNSRIYSRFENYIETSNSFFSFQTLLQAGKVDIKTEGIVDLGDGTSLTYTTKNWGLFQIITVENTFSPTKNYKSYMLGCSINKNATLYIENNDRHLYVSGNTQIEGTCYLPSLGIKGANFGGSGYSGAKKVEGTVLVSENRLPQMQDAILNIIKNYKQLVFNSNVKDFEITNNQKSLTIDFSDTTLVLYSLEEIRINNKTLNGNIVVISDKGIHIEASAHLKDIILCAPIIDIEDNAEVQIQAFAEEKLELGRNAKLTYPSSLVLISDSASHAVSIILNEKAEIQGNVLLHTPYSLRNQSEVLLKKDSKVNGMLYCSNRIHLRDNFLMGSTYCKKLFIQTPAGFYENQLHNVSVSNLPKEIDFASGCILNDNRFSLIITSL